MCWKNNLFDRYPVAVILFVFQGTFPNTYGLLVKGNCWQVSSKKVRLPSAGPLFRSVVDSSMSLLVLNRFFQLFFVICAYVREVKLMDAPYSIWTTRELKPVFPTLLSHFLWRHAWSMVLGGILEQALTLPTVQTVFIWLARVLRKKRAKVPPLIPKSQWKQCDFPGKIWQNVIFGLFWQFYWYELWVIATAVAKRN